MSLSTCTKCGGHIPLGPDASNICETCGAGVFDGGERVETTDPSHDDVQLCLRLLVYAGLRNGPATDRTGEEHKKAAALFFTDAVIDAAIAKIHDGSWCAAVDGPSTVRIPTSEDEAAAMALLGTNYLERHAPHRLRLTAIIAKWEQIAQEAPRDNMVYNPATIRAIIRDLRSAHTVE